MKYSKVILTAIAGILAGVSASDVVQLTGDTFDEFVSEHPVVMAEFFAPWCGHCKALAPEYEEAATQLKPKDIHIAKIDCTEEETLCAEHKIQGYPTLKVFHGLDKVSPYQGARKSDAIISYMIRQSLPAVSDVTKDNVEEFSKSNDIVVVGFFDGKKDNATFTDLGENLREKYIFGASKDKELAAEYGITKFPAAVIFKSFDEPSVVYDSSVKNFDFSADGLTSFIKTESFPNVGEIGPATFSDYANSDLPLLYLFVDNDEDKEELVEVVKPLLAKTRGKLHVGTLDAKLYGGHASNVNLKEEWPAVAIEDFTKNLRYIHGQDKAVTAKSLKKFVEDFVAGKVEPHVKSEDIPEEQGPVYTVVGKNYNDVVLDDEKDVLVEFYAPWCGHCKNLAPTYEQLGALYSDSEFADKVTIAKIDHTANDVPDKIAGYPTIKLYPAGAKDAPIDFQGARDLESFVEFIKEHGTNKVDVTEFLAAKKEADEKKKEEEEKAKREEAEKEEDAEQVVEDEEEAADEPEVEDAEEEEETVEHEDL